MDRYGEVERAREENGRETKRETWSEGESVPVASEGIIQGDQRWWGGIIEFDKMTLI